MPVCLSAPLFVFSNSCIHVHMYTYTYIHDIGSRSLIELFTWSNGFSASSWNRPLSSQFLRNRVGVGVWSGGRQWTRYLISPTLPGPLPSSHLPWPLPFLPPSPARSPPPTFPGPPPFFLTNEQCLSTLAGHTKLERELMFLSMNCKMIIV